MVKNFFLIYLCISGMLYAEPINKFSVGGNLNNNGNMIVNQSISNGSKSINFVRIKINDNYDDPVPTIAFTSFSATNRVIVKCNDEELIINPNTSKTIEIKTEAKLYSGYISKTDNQIAIDFNKFKCTCINCTFMKE